MILISEIRNILTTAPVDVAAGAVVITLYVLTHLAKKQQDRINLSNTLTVFGSGFSLLPGLSVLLAGFETTKAASGIEQSYFFIGGFAVIYLGLQEIYKKFREVIIPPDV